MTSTRSSDGSGEPFRPSGAHPYRLRLEPAVLLPGGVAVLRPAGTLDHRADALLDPAVAALLADGARHLVVDLAGVTRCDSRGVDCLLGVRHCMRVLGGAFAVASAQGPVLRTIAACGAGRELSCFPDTERALDAVRRGAAPGSPH
ncbi:STAS domain-containing protein [Streptomyces sp. NPDC001380]|uniref:STAS domain-containing protein n=1 Tax=Streptomyces sp. NPDC001380 TaxID=3364566 RepID=UPI0036AB2456